MRRLKRKKKPKRSDEHANVFRRFVGPALEPEATLARNQAGLHMGQVAWNDVQLDRRSEGHVDARRVDLRKKGIELLELYDFLVARRRGTFADHDWFVDSAELSEVDGVVVMSIETLPPKTDN